MRSQLAEKVVRLRQVLAVGVFAFVQIRDSVEAKSIYAE
jgi:hypothetical protein